MTAPIIGVTLGEPGGIGSEIVLKHLVHDWKKAPAYFPVIFGTQEILKHPALQTLVAELGPILPFENEPQPQTVYLVDTGNLSTAFTIGKPDATNGAWVDHTLRMAARYAMEGRINGLVTAPICKESLQLAQVPYTGHTTLLQAATGSSDVSMAFYTPKLKTILTTIHTPLRTVPSLLTKENLTRVSHHAIAFAHMLGLKNPRIAMAGLNPHAGENGLLGSEEKDILTPFTAVFEQDGIRISGPFPPDTLYYRAAQGEFDIVISLYHDQGLIPIKLIGFETAVNLTIGLPFIRTSPDHGTAFDIAYQNKASHHSFSAAVDLAVKLIIHGA